MSKASNDHPDMRVLKTATCKTITGKSTLTYQIGSLPNNAVHLRITKNTGAGFFNDEWIALKDILSVLAKCPEGSPITSFLLQPLFKGKSANSPAFMVAALTHEKLLRVLKGKKRGHELLDPEGFNVRMSKLATSKAKPKGATTSTRKKTVTGKTAGKTAGTVSKKAAKKKATSRKKTAKTV